MMRDYQTVTVNVDYKLLNRIDDKAHEMRLTRSDLIRDALDSYMIEEDSNIMNVITIYNLALCNVEIRRDTITGQVLYREPCECGSPDDILERFYHRKVKALAVDGDKLIVVIKK